MRRSAAALALGLALLALPAGSSDGAGGTLHVVRPGETLWHIAAEMLADPYRWPEIYRANRDQIADPAVIFPGQKLRIPPRSGKGPGQRAEGDPLAAPRAP